MPHVAIGGRAVHYRLDGPEGAPVVAFSNALGSDLGLWEGVMPRLAARYRCLRYDTRGHGGSQACDAPVTIEALAGDLAGLLDALGIARAHCAGISLGGMVAQALAIRAPERVASLALIATAAHLPSAASWAERAATVREKGTAAIAEATLERWLTAPFRAGSPEAVERLRAALLACDPGSYAACCGAIGGMDLRPRLSAIRVPALVVAGREDPSTTPTLAEEICAGLGEAELVLLPRAAHMLAVERAEALAGYLGAFLERREKTGPDA
ncbi:MULTISPECIES: 3-oxoadipate enol-lactonase [Methylobacterium]|uniref:3-oxoadipate enol-lactonase 2 n=1 Tax=Methylobacterium jeotgali TaxID=381630 RepID=A0ABQ4SU30_9HYPH|nr:MULTISPECIES: 3-oxoadipate enol-lactonase [Methylobacterium]PIU07611.1 MAG: 3-oxoadipate enol-lactonase [Methylobacterium sp. CG09_land_8_20_14_0_10_71_15]PIU12935.1 MAG: 3-oxoadipate enol-lactonase [Methylobacterium sp. CG08_land_8_20_14_0_20_71_15]GBU15937.1 3-oxoadipate enol-lactonase [Methylobacterium sp.]GJE05390.1 3-oxoadipate enol-lactonase 2 [Methylobacterium jeotgali]